LPNFLFSGKTPKLQTIFGASPHQGICNYNLAQATAELEKNLILKALQESPNKSAAIHKLGISRRTFYQKIKKYGLG